jgi:hypothetical protein
MESEIQNAETTSTELEEMSASIDNEIVGWTPPAKPAPSEQPWQEWVDVVVDFLGKIPEQLGEFFADYQQPLTTLALILTAGITVYVTLSVLDAISNIPLLSSILELVGLGYSIWFVTRYLLKASTRQELFAEFDSLKQQILGGKTSD